jgi:hypothetical protein
MSAISNLNIILQQGGGAREAQQIKSAMNDHTHVVSANQKEKDVQQQTTVQQSNQSERSKSDKDSREKRKRKRQRRPSQSSDTGSNQPALSTQAGKLVDTVA